jgi:hypothetical protein
MRLLFHLEVVLQSRPHRLAGGVSDLVVQVVCQIDRDRWHGCDNVTGLYKYCCYTIYTFQCHNLYIYVCLTCSMEQITIQGTPVIDIYESFDGSYWFAMEKAWQQDSIIRGKVYKNDQIFFGYVRLSSCPECAEWGYFSEAELRSLGPRIWKVPRQDWPVCPCVAVEKIPTRHRGAVVDSCESHARSSSHSSDNQGGDKDGIAGV